MPAIGLLCAVFVIGHKGWVVALYFVRYLVNHGVRHHAATCSASEPFHFAWCILWMKK